MLLLFLFRKEGNAHQKKVKIFLESDENFADDSFCPTKSLSDKDMSYNLLSWTADIQIIMSHFKTA